MGKKEKREREQNDVSAANGDSESQEKHRKKKRKNREKVEEPQNEAVLATDIPTVTIAVPGSIIDNAQSLELATRLAGQLARAATIFRIDEAIGAYDGLHLIAELQHKLGHLSIVFLVSHAGCGKSAGAKNACITREKKTEVLVVHLLMWGLSKNVMIDEVLEPGIRVTVEMGTNRNLDAGPPRKVVPSSRPREEGMYWGYEVRYASNISSVFKNCPYQGGYDHRIGTSEHGSVINSSELTLPSFRHLLIAFGGLAGLEECVEEDGNLKGKNVRDIFDLYLNTCPHQGSRTIRTEVELGRGCKKTTS
ncbi:putative methyltransferase C9o [Sesamum angolense]|uniref:Methyltransferase C9o n=1 Tax=Sesamum angolense TaxID=2727404 RepID=A0AAE1W881_9LAMI|nr:putative methyltransferase C9o [Sesamum angolense]